MQMNSKLNVLWLARFAVALLAIAAFGANAEDLEPRAYANTPVGINFLGIGYSDMDGSVTASPSIPLKDAELNVKTTVFAYSRSLDVWGSSGKFDVIIPVSDLSGTATLGGVPKERNINGGLLDPRFRFSVNFYGAPALTLAEFPSYQQDVIIGGSLAVTAPFGQYDSDKLVNLGNNRWSFKPELGISKRFGAMTLEFAAAGTFYTDNDEFLGHHTLSQDPIYSAQGHLIYAFKSGIWGALDATRFAGGNTTVDGDRNRDLQENTRVGLTLAIPVNRNQSLKLYESSGAYTHTGSDYTTVGVIWQYRFGGGF
jgi:Putative MetA-pathway of phenol degradation